MRSSLFYSFLAALPLAALAYADAEPEGFAVSENSTLLFGRQTSSTACPKKGIHIIAAPGAGGTGPNDYGYLASTIVAIQNAIPGSNNFCLGPYSGSNGLYQTENAELQTRKHLIAFHRACPKIPVALVGYSTGAIGVMNAACGASPSPPWAKSKAIDRPRHKIFAMVTFGDETFKAGQPYNRGSCTQNAPKYPRTTAKGCKPFWPHIRAFCDADDGDCCTGGVDGGPAHFAYPTKYNNRVVHFVKHQLKLFKKKQSHKKHHHKKHNN